MKLYTWEHNWRLERGFREEIPLIEDSLTSTIEDSVEIDLFQEILDTILDLDMTASKHPEDEKIQLNMIDHDHKFCLLQHFHSVLLVNVNPVIQTPRRWRR